jgi:putative transposase
LLALFTSQGSQYGSDDWHRFCGPITGTEHEKRGNCQDNAVAELFFSSLKKNAL